MFPTLMKKNIVLSSLVEQMDGAHFPVMPDQVPSNFNFVTNNPLEFLNDNGFKIEPIQLNHPGGAIGFKININGKEICYFTNDEIDPPYPKIIDDEALINKCKNADVLNHDAQYIEEYMPLKHGWGHSLIRQVSEIGNEAKVKNLVYFHHEPERTDEELDNLFIEEKEWFIEQESETNTIFAKEGLTITL